MRWQIFIHDIIIAMVMTLFMFRLYMPKIHKKYIYFIVFAATLIAIIGTGLFQNEIIRYFIAVISANIITLWLFRVKIRECMVKNTVFILLVLLGDIAAKSLTFSLTESALLNLVGLRLATSLASLTEWILLILCFKLVIFFFSREKKGEVQIKELVFISLLTLGELLLSAYMLSLISSKQSGIIMALMLFLFIVLNLYIVRLIQEVESVGILERELELATQQSQIQLKCYQEMITEQELSHKIIHDVRKHLQTLEGLYKFQKNQDNGKYAQQMEEELDKLAFSFPCENLILCVIINSKLAEAHTNYISFEPRIEDINLNFISELDITAIFSNLLDNSFEACIKIPEKERFVRLSLLKVQEFLVLNIQNPFSEILEEREGVFSTTKDGHMGIGLSNIRRTVEKYDGVCKIEVENHNFTVAITMPIL